MKDKYLILVENESYLKDYEASNICAFLFALEEFSVGYINTFKITEIPKTKGKVYLLINRTIYELKSPIYNTP